MVKAAVRLFVSFSLLGCTVAAATEYTVSNEGLDSNPGTSVQPFRTIQKAADLMLAGDTCIVRGGVYREVVRPKVSGKLGAAVRFVAYPGEKVVLKGTEPIAGPWSVYRDKIYQTKVDIDQTKVDIDQTKVDGEFAQLFIDEAMMVEARWPNMRFPDDLWDRSKWSRAGKGSRYGEMVDPELAKTGIDWTGARATLNVAHQFFSWTRQVETHGSGRSEFTYAKDLAGITHFADKTTPWEDDRYYLSGKLEALDAPGEWFLDVKSHTLYLWPPDGKMPAPGRVHLKARNYAFEVKDHDYIEVSGFQFFGATFQFENCNHCVVEDCHLAWPTYARRINDPAVAEPWADRTLVSGSRNTVRKCSLAYSPTSGLVMLGSDNVAEDNLIHDICWYGSLHHVPLDMGPMKSAKENKSGIVRHNTVYNFGSSGILFFGQSCVVEYNHVYAGGLACLDVSLIYTHMPTCAGSVVSYNWVHGCRTESGGGLGIRGDDQTRGLTVHHNVVWDCGRDGIIVKGDQNKVYNNTVLDIGSKAKLGQFINLPTVAEPKKPWRYQAPLLKRQNANSEVFNNAALTITCNTKGDSFPGIEKLADNYRGKDLQLVDPQRLDFRPSAGSPLIDAGREIIGITGGFKGKAPDIGAYEFNGDCWRAGIRWKPRAD